MYYFLTHKLSAEGGDENQQESRAANTYLLALDGDVDFEPKAVQLLVDNMKVDPENIAAACGRIHPKGLGRFDCQALLGSSDNAVKLGTIEPYTVLLSKTPIEHLVLFDEISLFCTEWNYLIQFLNLNCNSKSVYTYKVLFWKFN